MLAHECVHIAQELGNGVIDFSLPYIEQPHEIEAYDMQEWLVMNSKINQEYANEKDYWSRRWSSNDNFS